MGGVISGTAAAGSGEDPSKGGPSKMESRRPPWGGLKNLFLPVGGAVSFHTAVVGAVLVVAAAFVAIAPPGFTGVLSSGPAIYLVLPAAAGLYMSLAAVSTSTTHQGPGRRTRAFFVPALLLAWTVGVLLLVVASDLPVGRSVFLASTPWLYPACLAGIGLPLASLWFDGPADPAHRTIGLCTALLPPLFAVAVVSPQLSNGGVIVLTYATLLLGAILFQISGTVRARSELYARSPSVPPTPAREGHRRSPYSARKPSTARGNRLLAPGPATAGIPERPVATAPASMPRPGVSTGRWPDVVSTGFGWLDDLLLGGFPRRGQVALVGEPGLGSDRVVWGTLSESLRRGETVVVVTASWSVRQIAEQMEQASPGFTEYDRGGRVLWVDASGQGRAARTQPPAILGPGDCVRLLASLHAAASDATRRSPGGFCVAFLGISTLIEAVGEKQGLTVLRNAIAILHGCPALVTYSIELRAGLTPTVGAIQNDLEGTLVFRSTEGHPAVKVFRLTPVANRGWVECGFGGRGNWLVPQPRPRAWGFPEAGSLDRRPGPA